MSSDSHTFWTENEEYHDLAETFERNIERHGARDYYECELNWIGGHEYRGPSV